MLPLAKHGFISDKLHTTHATNLTPHMAIGAYYLALMVEVFIWHLSGTSALTMFNDAGTLAATGFLFAYFMVTVAAPLYLRKRGELKAVNVAVAVAGFVLLMVPLVGLFYPLPTFPVDIFPAIFAGFMLAGRSWLFVLNRRVPGTLTEIEASLETALDEGIGAHSDVEEGARIGFEMPGLGAIEAA